MEEDRNESEKRFKQLARQELERKIQGLTELLGLSDGADTISPEGSKGKVRANKKSTAVHDGHRERMRSSARKDIRLEGFSDVEILEYLLAFMIPRKDTNVTAHRLLDRYGSVTGVLYAPQNELSRFLGLTAQAARVLPLLKNVCAGDGRFGIKLDSRQSAVDFFGALYAGGIDRGTYAAYLDGNSGLAAVELTDFGADGWLRDMVGAAVRHNARKVILARCDTIFIDPRIDLSVLIANLYSVLAAANVELVDFLMFIDYGYYTLCDGKRNYDGWVPQYLFIPDRTYARAPDALDKVYESDGAENDVSDADMADQLYRYISYGCDD